MLISLSTYAPSFTFCQLWDIYPLLDENFWEVYAYMFCHMQLNVYFEICLYDIKLPYIILFARIVMVSMLDVDNVCVFGMSFHLHVFCMGHMDT